MRKIFWLLILILMMISGCGNDDEKIIVGVDEKFPPMAFRNEQGEIVGFEIDLAREASKRMGVEFEFKPIDWNNKREEILSGNVDMIWNGLDITDERKEYMLFSKPYMDSRQIIMVKYGNPKEIHSVSDLSGKIVGTQAGSNAESYINSTPRLKNSFAEFKVYRNVQNGFDLLAGGGFDALIIDEIVARYEMVMHPAAFQIIEDTISPATSIGIGFRQEDTELRDRVQKVFDEMVADGTAKKISEQWFQANLIKHRK